jgi:hypothetical protein
VEDYSCRYIFEAGASFRLISSQAYVLSLLVVCLFEYGLCQTRRPHYITPKATCGDRRDAFQAGNIPDAMAIVNERIQT